MASSPGTGSGPPRSPTLVVIRGNSGSGKSTIAKQLQLLYGRGCALVEQDYLRRIVLRERDVDGGIAPALIEHTTRFALAHGYHVVLEGILVRHRYGAMLEQLAADHPGRSVFFYLDVSYAETIRRHAGRPQASQFTAEDMRGWYLERDVLGVPGEVVIPQSVGEHGVVSLIAATAGLDLAGRDEDWLPSANGIGGRG
jgi:predicted kinase